MRRTTVISTLLLAAALVSAAAFPSAAEDIITIDFSGLHLMFSDGNIYDADHLAGGNGALDEATPLGSITFYKNNEYVTELGSDVYADILIKSVPGIAENDFITTGGGMYVDLLSSSGTLLSLPIGEMYVTYTNFGTPYVGIIGFASGAIVQNLPNDLIINPDSAISILLTGDVFNGELNIVDKLLVGFDSTGMGEIEGQAVPEPGMLALLLCLAASAVAGKRFFGGKKTF